MDSSRDKYRFGEFLFDSGRLALYFREGFVQVERRSLEVLAVLVRRAEKVVSTSEIIETVWRENPSGVTPTHLAQNIRKLRNVFAKLDPERTYIRNVKGVGFIFDINAEPDAVPIAAEAALPEPLQIAASSTAESRTRPAPRYAFLGIALVPVLALFVISWFWYPQNDQREVERVVRDSQMYESLVLYKDPASFKEADLDRYWTTDIDVSSNYDRRRIREAAQKLAGDGRRYGDETKSEQFDFQSIEIDAGGETAIVKTLEKWFISVYLANGTLQKNKNVGPYFVSYIVRKIDGRWLIEKSNTARATPSAPIVAKIEPVTQAASGQQFFVRLTGEDILPELVFIKIVGEGCPETNPCIIPNSALRGRSKLSDKAIDNLPLTLASGEFLLFAHNGESPASNPVSINVP